MRPLRFMAIWLLCLAGSCLHQPARTQVANLRCEYHSRPLGLDVRQPRLSWNLLAKARGVTQSAYRILVASTPSMLQQARGDLWDSGMIRSNQTLHIPYQGKPLKSRQAAYWKVMIWDQNGRPSAWSAPGTFEMALLETTDWHGRWISAANPGSAADWPAPLFRKSFQLLKNIRQARLYISGLGYYEASLNGTKISDHVLSPNQSNYDRRHHVTTAEPNITGMSTTVYYETFDVTPLLQSGDNALGIMLGNGWYYQRDRLEDTNMWYDTPRLLAQLEVWYQNGQRQIIASDETWRTSASPILHNGLHTGEIYDRRKEQVGWDQVGFDDSGWHLSMAVRPPTGLLTAQIFPADRVIKTLPARSLTMPEPGVYQFDLGQMISGWARLKITGPAGTAVQLRFIEEMGPSYGQTDTYILNGKGLEVWEPRFTWHAFRYVQVINAPTPLAIDAIEGRMVNTDVDSAGSFVCSNSLFNKILQNYRWTQLGNLHGGVPSDCPHRERRGYTGDGQLAARAAIYNFDMALLYSKWMNDIRDAQNHLSGYVPNTAPYQGGGGGTAWGSACVLIPWYMYQYYGDIRLLEESYGHMQKWIDYLSSQLNQYGLLADQGLGEWVPPDITEIPETFVNTCYYKHNLDIMAQCATVLRRGEDAQRYAAAAERTRTTLHRVYLNSDRCSYSIGRQGADVFPLAFNITPDSLVQPVLSHLIAHLLEKCQGHFDTGILATPLLLQVLSTYQRNDLAYTLMNHMDFPSFGYMISKGATTIWETWMGDQSHSHPMFGSVCQWFYEQLAGIAPDPLHPGFQRMRLQPHPLADLSFVKASYRAATGTIHSHWRLQQNDFIWDVRLPANTTAALFIPAQSADHVSESGKPINADSEIVFKGMENGYAVYDIPSGEYHFISSGIGDRLAEAMIAAPVILPGDTLIEKPNRVSVRIESRMAAGEPMEIRYTLDGSEPDRNALRYTEPFTLDHTAVIKAKSIKKGAYSFTRTQLIQFVDPNQNGLHYRTFYGTWKKLPDMDRLQAGKSGHAYRFALDDIVSRDDLFAVQYHGKIRIDQAGLYTFYLLSNDGSNLYLNDKWVVNNDGEHGAEERKGDSYLSAGLHPIRVDYFQAGGGMLLKVSYSSANMSKREIAADVLYQ